MGSRPAARPALGALLVLLIVGLFGFSIALFRGGLGTTSTITVVSERAGLVMNPDAKVRWHGVQVGQVQSIETRPDGRAVLRLAMDPTQLSTIPANVAVDITSSTVFGAKFVQFTPPPNPSAEPLTDGGHLEASHVTVETNTLFQQLTRVLRAVDPVKLNETLAAVSGAINGRGEELGQTVSNFTAFLRTVNPSLDNINRDLEMAPLGLNAYADVAPELADIIDNTTALSETIVDQQDQLDTFLASSIGLADTGNAVLSENLDGLTALMHMLVPTTTLAKQYSDNLRCGLQGLGVFTHAPPPDRPGVNVSANFTLGVERYHYPEDLPKVAATSGPSCHDQMLPVVPLGKRPPFLVADVGANPWRYGNQGVLLNSDALKQLLFGPIQGPPRNSAQIGMPG